jgi:branched-chain amino acid transport system ATP-binding protein
MLSVRNLAARYGRARALDDVSFDLPRGAAWLLLGRNGAGKSTLLKTLIGLVRPSAGSIRFAGVELAGREPFRIARLGLGYVPEERRIFADLTVAENLLVGARPAAPGMPAWTAERLFALFPNLAELRRRPAGRMSGGEQQMLAIARTLMGNPSLVLLDEPGEGLSPLIVGQLAEALRKLRGEGVTLLLAEPHLRFAHALGDAALILEQGRLAWAGPLATLRAEPELQRRYLAV